MSGDRTQKSSSSLNDTLHKRHRDIDVFGLTSLNFAPISLSSSPIQRKASCACGGGCPSCAIKNNEKSSDLKVSQPNDAAEIEADRIADTVMRMPVSDGVREKPASAIVAPMIQAKSNSGDISGGTFCWQRGRQSDKFLARRRKQSGR